MTERPNILILMADQMRGDVLRPGHPCRTPHIDRVARRGVRFDRAYTPNAICSPARASLMTGLLPHNHGVLWVTHNVDTDQGLLREDKPHWAQRLVDAGYRTAYFGKWHVERTEQPSRFGWQIDGSRHGELYAAAAAAARARDDRQHAMPLRRMVEHPPGYRPLVHYGAADTPMDQRPMGIVTGLADTHLSELVRQDEPWCCFVATTEPHDPYVTSPEALAAYDIDALPLDPTLRDPLTDQPNVYRKQAQVWAGLTDREHREAAACYYALISELDEQFGRLISRVEQAGQLDRTIVIITSDHGELLGSHGLYCKNIGAFEPAYNVPLVIAGPGIAGNAVSRARVGLHDLAPTLLDLLGLDPIGSPDSRSFASVLGDPPAHDSAFERGYAEYFGGRYMLTQRIVWDGDWKFVHNGFDYDELYHLGDDPHETTNLARSPEHAATLRRMVGLMWRRIEETGDTSLLQSVYPPLRLAPFGPLDAGAEPR